MPPIVGNARYSATCVGRSLDGFSLPSTILPSRSVISMSAGVILSYGTPLGLITHRPPARSTALALPNVKITRPRRTNSRFASKTSARSASSTLASSNFRGETPQLAQRFAAPKREIQLAIHRVQPFAAVPALDDMEAGAEAVLRLFDALERARGHECEDCGAKAGHIALGHQDRLAHHVGVHPVQHRVLLRNAASVDDSPHRD